jgi:hypothetical protein
LFTPEASPECSASTEPSATVVGIVPAAALKLLLGIILIVSALRIFRH